MKKFVPAFLVGILFSLAACNKENPPPCPEAPTKTGQGLNLPVETATKNIYHLDVYYVDSLPTPGSYFDVTVTPEGKVSRTYQAPTDGLSHTLSNNDLGIATVEFSVPLSAKTFTVVTTGKLAKQIQHYCNGETTSQPTTYPNSSK